MQTSFILVISFVFSSWIINEFEKEFSGTIQLLDNFADRVLENSIRNQVSYDHRSNERNLSNCVWKPEKVRISTGFEPVTSRYRCDAQTN